MKPYEHEGQIHIPHRKHPFKTRAAMVVVGVACIALTMLGWVESVRTTVRQGVSGARETFSGAGTTFSEFRSRTTIPDGETNQENTTLDASVSPYLDAAEERMQALDLVSGIVKEQIDSEKKEDSDISTPPEKVKAPPSKATPPDISPEPTE